MRNAGKTSLGAPPSAVDSSIRNLVLILLVMSPLLVLFGPNPVRSQLTTHSPIFITYVPSLGQENFTSAGASGTGQPGDPYIIEGWNITTNAPVGIHIKNTHSFFVIRNVFIKRTVFTGTSEGINLENVQNGQVSNAKIANFYYGASFSSGSTDTITTSNLWNNTYGVYMTGTYDTVSNSNMWHNAWGIYMTGTNDKATSNHAYNNTKYGVQVSGSTLGFFSGNNASINGNQTDGAGFFITGSNNIFDNNTASGNTWFGLKMVGSPFLPSSNNVFSNNTVSGNGNRVGGGGIVLVDNCTKNLIAQNNLTDQVNALGLEAGDFYNNITGNRITNSTTAIYVVADSSHNLIYNNYLNSSVNAVDNGHLNNWNTTKTLHKNILGGPFVGGNFYADYKGTDPDGDGIGDTSYSTSGVSTLDLLPLVRVQPTVVHEISVQSVSTQPASPRVGTSLDVKVAVFNQGTVPESFDVSLTYNQTNTVTTQHVASLPAWSGTVLTLSWTTTGLGAGTYVLRANASIVPGETYTANNVSPPTIIHLTINQPPLAWFTISVTSLSAGGTVTLDATASSDPDGTVASYTWNFGDGSPIKTVTTPTISQIFANAGSFTITLTVTDNEGASSNSFTKSLTVSSSSPGAPGNLQLSATSGRATLSWAAPGNTGGSPIIKYRVYRGTSPSTIVWIANTTDTSYLDTTVNSGQTYYYSITAVNEAGMESPASSQNVLVPLAQNGASNLLTNPQLLLAIAAAAVIVAVASVILTRRRRAKANPTSA